MNKKSLTTYPSFLKQRPVYVAPANPAGQILAGQLTAMGVQVVGLFDNLKKGHNIYTNKDDCQENAIIVVCEGNFQHDICLGLLERGFHSQAIICQKDDTLKLFKHNYRSRWQQTSKKIIRLLVKFLLRILPQRKHIYYTEQFIDTNLLIAWRYHQKKYSGEALLLGHKLNQIPDELSSIKGIIYNQPLRILWHLLQAKSLILDHEFHSLVFDTVRQNRPVVQMFHGLPLKNLKGNKHYPHINDRHFISSSAWVNKHIFSSIFNAQNFHALGYPRNDALMQTASERDWITAPSLKKLNDIVRNTGNLIVYMPTYRDDGNNKYPIDYEKIEKICQKNNYSFILKFHPFVAEQLASTLGMTESIKQPTLLPGFQHIYMFPPGFNIYPWLAETKLLITDYSSVLFDYLTLKRPILLYQYDYDIYLANRGKFMLSLDSFNIGKSITTFDELEQRLIQSIESNFPHENWQEQIQQQLGLVTQNASQSIVNLVQKEYLQKM